MKILCISHCRQKIKSQTFIQSSKNLHKIGSERQRHTQEGCQRRRLTDRQAAKLSRGDYGDFRSQNFTPKRQTDLIYVSHFLFDFFSENLELMFGNYNHPKKVNF